MLTRDKLWVLLVMVGCCIALPGFAEAPYERYHVAYKDISREVLRNTIGILTINSGGKRGMTLRTHIRMAGQFVPDAGLNVADTIPVSNFGYHPPSDSTVIDNYRYPIIETIGSYARIVYASVNNLSAWINLDETRERFGDITLTLVHELDASLPFYVDIFCFTESGRRKVYKSPGKGAGYFIAAKADKQLGLLKIMEVGEGYLKLGKPRFNETSFELEGIDPVGWVRIRDDQGQLTFWINLVDGC